MENQFNLKRSSRATARVIAGAGLGAILLYGAFFVPDAQAYNPHATHTPLAERSVELFNRDNPDRTLTSQEKQWVAEGASDEDNPATRVVNHFYDPINDDGLSGFSSSKRWAHNGSAQELNRFGARDMSWEAAVEAYETGDKELAYRALGHLLHLIQDATVPAHTRQDPHLHIEFGTIVLDGYGGKDPYERQAERLTAPSISGLTTSKLSSFNAYLETTARYTNTRFLSMDSAGFYKNPGITKIENGYLYAQNGSDEYVIAFLPGVSGTKLFSVPIKLKENNFEDPRVTTDYWSRLAPVAIENGAGVIQLFRDTVREPQPKPSDFGAQISSFFSSGVDIAQQFGARGQATWELVKFGWNRHAIDLASISFALQTNNTSSVTSTTYQAQREEVARKAFLTQLQSASAAATTSAARTIPSPTQALEEQEQRAQEPTPEPEQTEGELVFVSRVIDGDTIEISDGRRVRYIGIDAPEVGTQENEGECFAEEATKRNSQLVLNKNIRITPGPQDMDAYNRLLRFVWADNILVNQSLIETGHARAYDFGNPHEYSELFTERQEVARNNEIGLWGPLCQEEREELLPPMIPPAKKTPILINEVRMQEYEFIELFNQTDEDVPLAGYFIAYYASTRTKWDDPSWKRLLPLDATIPAGGFFTISFGPEDLNDGNSDWHPYQTDRLAQTLGAVALFANDPTQDDGTLIDALGWGPVKLSEGLSFRNLPKTHGSVSRPNKNKRAVDRNNNIYDFYLTYIPTPGTFNEILVPPVATPEDTPIQLPEDTPESDPIENIIISEIQVGGTTANDEFIELYNGSATEVSIVGWSLKKKTQSGTESNLISAQSFAGTIPAGMHFLIVPQTPIDGVSPYTGSAIADTTYSGASYSIAANNTVLLYDSAGNLLDKVGYGTAGDFEGSAAAPGPSNGQSIARLITEDGVYQDTDDNANDFELSETPTPQNTADGIIIPEEEPWQTPLSSTDIRHPSVDNSENIYFSEGNGIASYNSEGVQRWFVTDVTAYEGATLSDDGAKLYTTGCGDQPATPQCYFATINASNGSISSVIQIESVAHNGGPTEPILDEDGNVYVAVTGFENGSIWKFTPAGDVAMEWPLSWEVIDWAALGIAEPRNYIERIQRVAVAGDTLLIAAQPLSNQHYLFAFHKDTGAFLWQIDMEQDNINRTLGVTGADEETFYTAYKTPSNEAGLAAYSALDGTLLWHEPFEETATWIFSLEINTTSGFAYAIPTPNHGKLYQFSLDTGTAMKLFEDVSGAEISTQLISDGANLYFATEDDIVRALRISDSGLLWEYDAEQELQHIIPAETFIYGVTETGALLEIEKTFE